MLPVARLLSAGPSASLSRAFSTSPALFAHKKGAGSTKNNRGSIGRRLGVKKFADELVQPGDIITRQRGTVIHPGQHVGVGRDHTLYALVPGYLKFYSLPHNRNRPHLSPNMPNREPPRSSIPIPATNKPKGFRRYVGITLRRDETLPRDERTRGRERLWFGTVEGAPKERTWEWQEDSSAEGTGKFVVVKKGDEAVKSAEGGADGSAAQGEELKLDSLPAADAPAQEARP